MSRDVSAAADRNTDNDETQLTELVEDSLTTLHVSLTKLVEDSLSIVHVSDAAERNTVYDEMLLTKLFRRRSAVVSCLVWCILYLARVVGHKHKNTAPQHNTQSGSIFTNIHH